MCFRAIDLLSKIVKSEDRSVIRSLMDSLLLDNTIYWYCGKINDNYSNYLVKVLNPYPYRKYRGSYKEVNLIDLSKIDGVINKIVDFVLNTKLKRFLFYYIIKSLHSSGYNYFDFIF